MTPALASIYARLIARFDQLSDLPQDGEDEAQLARAIEGTMRLITWIDLNPESTLEQYRAQVEVEKGAR